MFTQGLMSSVIQSSILQIIVFFLDVMKYTVAAA